MVNNTLTNKQKEVKKEIEENKDIENIYIFKSTLSEVRDLQVGKRGPIATKYKISKNDIKDIVSEIENLLEKEV